MILAYNTNGFAGWRLADAIRLLAGIGYGGVEISLCPEHLHPAGSTAPEYLETARLLKVLRMSAVVGAGHPHALGPERFEPTLMSPSPGDRRRRIDFLRESVAAAALLGAGVVVLNSGPLRPGADPVGAWGRLVEGLRELCGWAAEVGVDLALEPEPGHFVESIADFSNLRRDVGSAALRVNLDAGHLACTEEWPPHAHVAGLGGLIANVHVDDVRGRVHRHLPPGQGEIDFFPLIESLASAGYDGFLSVELNRHSAAVQEVAAASFEFLVSLLGGRLQGVGAGC